MRLQSCVFGAFAQALPDIMPAACGDGGPLINVRTTDPRTGRRLMANLDPITGGAGRQRGGTGTTLEFQVFSPHTSAGAMAMRYDMRVRPEQP